MFLILIFLVAVQTVLTFWSQVGGQAHLELMFWPWKLGITLAAATLVTMIAKEARRGARLFTRRSVFLCSLLIAVAVIAGVVTLYYHQNEGGDEDVDSEEQQTSLRHGSEPRKPAIPAAAGPFDCVHLSGCPTRT